MSLTRKAASGAAWSIGVGVLVRIVGLAGTLVITHFLAPAVMGEVAAATVLAFTANWMSHWGFNQYVVVKGGEHEDALFHVTVLHVTLGMLALAIVVLLVNPFAEIFNAPNLASYLPGMALVVAIRRVVSIPDKLLVRDMRFKLVALANGAGELTYVLLAVGLVVATDLGGQAIVVANIAQALVVACVEIPAAGLRRWLTPKRWSWSRVREILLFGAPLGVETLLSEAGRYWDKLMFARLFGPHDTGMYSLAFNLSDLPATYVGEHVATALFPTMVQIAPERRNQVFAEASGLLALVVVPMAVGLASVADTLVKVILAPAWQGVADFLVVLAAIAIFRPLNSVIASLLIATERNWTLMSFEVLRITVLFGGMWYLSRFGEVAAAGAVGLAMAAQSAGILAVMTRQGFPALKFFAELRGPVIASTFIVVAVWGVGELFEGWPGVPLVVQLGAEVALGALAYLGGALLFARGTLDRFLGIVRQQLRRRAGAAPQPVASP